MRSRVRASGRRTVILTDIALPGMSGIEGIRVLRARFPHIPILALTVHDSDTKVFDALCAGASGYLLKNTLPERLLEALREVAAGGAPMSPEVARRVVRLFREFRPPDHAPYRLTPQESELLKTARRRASPEDRGARAGHQRQHSFVPSEEHLRQAAGALEDGSGRQGAARTADLKHRRSDPHRYG